MNLRDVEQTVVLANDRLVARLSMVPLGDRRIAAERGAALTHAESGRFNAELQATLGRARLRAKAASNDHVGAEWAALALAIGRAGAGTLPPSSQTQAMLQPTDAASVGASASSITAAWALGGIAALWTWADGETPSPGPAVQRALGGLRAKVERTVATETARGFADARDEAMATILNAHRDAAWLPGLYRRWDAMLDRKLCDRCRAHDGGIVREGRSFAGGAEPGYVHPNCRCISTMLFLPDRVARPPASRAA